MVNAISDIDVAAAACAGSGTGALLPSGARGTWLEGTAAVVFARPRARRAADVLGQRRSAAGHGVAPGQSTAKQYLNMTRIAAASGGVSGPHPARDPV
jgi:hypothetical protein